MGARCRPSAPIRWRRFTPPKATPSCPPTTGAAKAMATPSAPPTATTWAAATPRMSWRALTRPSPKDWPTRSASPSSARPTAATSSTGSSAIPTASRPPSPSSASSRWSRTFPTPRPRAGNPSIWAATPGSEPELYAERSPATYLQDIQTPVLIMHGEGDPNTFVANSQEMYQALHLLGRTVEYVHYPREGHGFGEPQHRLDEIRRSLAWFDKYLRGGGTADGLPHRRKDRPRRLGTDRHQRHSGNLRGPGRREAAAMSRSPWPCAT